MTRRVLFSAIAVLSLTIAVGLALAIADRLSPVVTNYGQPQPPGDGFTVRLTVSPAAAPDPALKYELLPRLHEKTLGNAADGYNRVFQLMAKAKDPEKDPDIETPQRWLSVPRDEFPADEARNLVTRHAERLRDAERAALTERCDWNLLARLRADGINTLLPEIQASREVAHLLALRSRLELLDGKTDESIRTLQTVFQIARHASDGPTHLHTVVGAVIGFYAVGRVEEVIQQPDAPNLYWARSGLPRPFTDPAAALEGDEISFRSMFPIIGKFEVKPVSVAEADKTVAQFFADLGQFRGEKDNNAVGHIVAAFGLEVIINRQHEAAKKELVARGRPAKEVEAMPAKQAVFLASWERYKSLRDGGTKWYRQPYPEALAGMERERDQFKQAKENAIENKDVFGLPFVMMTPAFYMSFEAHVRFERRLAALRAVEALRLHVAKTGRWPAKLEEVKEVAVPDDPDTGNPFAYEVKGNRATLSGVPPQGQKPTDLNRIRYELTVRPVK